jgi:hypothetical protein
MFKELYPEEPADYYYYLKVFREHCSLSFGRHQVDTCLTCEEMTVKLLSISTMGKNVLKNDKRSFKISKYREFSYSRELPGIIKARNFIDGLLEGTFNLNVNSKRPTPLQFPKNVASSDGVPINKNKMADLKQFEQYIPLRFMKFHQRIFQWKTTDKILDEYQTPDD